MIKKSICVVLVAILLCIGLVGCSNNEAIDIVKTGELQKWPGKPIAETFQAAFEEAELDYDEEWEDVSDTFDTLLDENQVAVRCQYDVSKDGEEQTAVIIYIVDTETEDFYPFSLSIDGEVTTDQSEMIGFFEDFFE